MRKYQLYVLHASLTSRSHAPSLWAEADRIRALGLQQAVVTALMDLGWIVDVDDSEADSGRVRWLVWARDIAELMSIGNDTPLGYLKLLKVNAVELDIGDSVRAWLAELRQDRGAAPAPPAASSIFEQVLQMAPRKDSVEGLEGSRSADADTVLFWWAMYRATDELVREGHGGGYGGRTRFVA